MERVDWDLHALILAFAATFRSPDPYKKVGACGLDKYNNVLGVAYNGLAPGKEVNEEFWGDRDARRPYILHAETNLLSRVHIGQIKTIAVTMQPCSCCATAIAAHRIKRVVYSESYDYDTKGLDVLKFYNIETVQIPKTVITNFINVA
jgi:dCMP deaminase